MKKIFLFALIFFLTVGFVFISCKKEKSCEGCKENNEPPIAIAGSDQVITLPTDSISLDGSSSNDPDGTISEWLWTKISGPATFTIVSFTSSKTVVRNLDTGVYKFELIVTDDKGLTAKDTMQVTVNLGTPINRPPVANAGIDQTVTLPTNTVALDGSASTDPDNNITGYEWTKISGPSSINIVNANAVQTQVTNLVEGVYQFELKVTDSGGLFDKDTVQVTVNAQSPPPTATCEPLNRPVVNVQLVHVGNLSVARSELAIVATNNRVFFAGGSYSPFGYSSRVDIYNTVTNTWQTAELSTPRVYPSAVAAGNKVFFAGGENSGNTSTRVDIYDITTNTWTTAELSQPRTRIVTAAVGSKVFFAGGRSLTTRVDIYDLATNTWSTKELSESRAGFTATTAGSKVYFAGGWISNIDPMHSTSATIDIYDDAIGEWSTSTLSTARGFHAGIFKSGKIFWAGGATQYAPLADVEDLTCQVEIKDINSQNTSFTNLSVPQYWLYENGVFEKNDKIAFTRYSYGSNNLTPVFDIYDTGNNSWSIEVSNISLPCWLGPIVSVNNAAYIAGGSYQFSDNLIRQVYRIEF